ncbi:hypothetical protein BKA57DRAFT_459905 [Linnemannia elongata]|nr:hypothetical protein BKA57DRAFT_459905 [Linnemannia elongata]
MVIFPLSSVLFFRVPHQLASCNTNTFSQITNAPENFNDSIGYCGKEVQKIESLVTKAPSRRIVHRFFERSQWSL